MTEEPAALTPEESVASEPADIQSEPPATLIVYVALLFVSWLVFWIATPDQPGQQAWVIVAQQLPGFVIALLMADGLYRRSRFAWTIGIVLGLVAIALGVLNQASGGEWRNVFTGGQVLSGALEVIVLLLPPTQRWVSGATR